MAAGYISPSLLPGWPAVVAGARESLDDTLSASSFSTSMMAPEGLHVGDIPTATSFLNSYVGSSTELSWNKDNKKAALDTYFTTYFDLTEFIMQGTVQVSATNVGNFIAQITNNYRSLKSQIANAANMTALNAIDITKGWPNNP
jgi:hypothetical protein